MKIVVLDSNLFDIANVSWEALKEFGEVKIYPRTQPEEILERAKDAEVILSTKMKLPKEILSQCTKLKYIGTLSTGYDTIDYNYAKEKGIIVANVPAYGTMSIAQVAMALLLEIMSKVGIHNASVKQGDWSSCKDFCYTAEQIFEMQDKNIGIIGFGGIGQDFGKVANAFGMNVKIYDDYQKDNFKNHPDFSFVSLEELITTCPIISIHCPLLESTKDLINKEKIDKMLDNVIIINTARGPIWNEQDIVDGLNSKKIYMVGLDALTHEPPQSNDPLMLHPRAIVTPHISWAANETKQRLLELAIDNLTAFKNGNPINVVNS